jgi:mRNA export factor
MTGGGTGTDLLVSSNWDGGVRVWEVKHTPPSGLLSKPSIQTMFKGKTMHANNAPVLSACFTTDGIVSGGCDKAVRLWRLDGTTPLNTVPRQIGLHDAPVKSVGYLKDKGLVVSGGWDSKVKFWDSRSTRPVHEFQLPGRVFDLDVSDNETRMVVATSDRNVLIFDLQQGPRKIQEMKSKLAYQTRCVKVSPDGTGFGIGGLEGRVQLQKIQPTAMLKKEWFRFKTKSLQDDNSAYCVNSISFYNHHHNKLTIATATSEGVLKFWNATDQKVMNKTNFSKLDQPITSTAFNRDGNLFAYSSSYDWSKGSAHYSPSKPNDIFIHYITKEEIAIRA